MSGRPRLLVSVRSAAEARAAWRGGADLIDVKEPGRGALGRADPDVWAAVRAALPAAVPVSVALGELAEAQDWSDADWSGIAYRKLGLAGAGPDWRRFWTDLRAVGGAIRRDSAPRGWVLARSSIPPDGHAEPGWVAVAYADWRTCPGHTPSPDEVLTEAIAIGCAAILVDTFGKGSDVVGVSLDWAPWVERARAAGLSVALAGGLDRARIETLAPLRPDWFAVRGAACRDRDRNAPIDPDCVAALARAIGRLP